jgi:hypothetical protein
VENLLGDQRLTIAVKINVTQSAALLAGGSPKNASVCQWFDYEDNDWSTDGCDTGDQEIDTEGIHSITRILLWVALVFTFFSLFVLSVAYLAVVR